MTTKQRYCYIGYFLVVCGLLAHAQCGRSDFAQVQFDYFSAHRPADPRSAAILQAKFEPEAAMIVVRVSEQKHDPFYSSPTQFKTSDAGNTWVPLFSSAANDLPVVPYGYFRSPSDSKIAYRLIPDLGLYLRSENGGRTWRLPQYVIGGKSRDQFAAQVGGRDGFRLDVSIVAVDPTQPRTLYAALRVVSWFDSDLHLKSHNVDGVYQSVDGGEHWRKFTSEILPFNLSWAGVSALGISPGNPNLMIGSGRHGIEKTVDGGKTWVPVGQVDLLEARPVYRQEHGGRTQMLGAPVVQDLYEFLFDQHAAGTVYMLSNRGIYKTIDSGTSWRLLDLGFDEIDAINSMALNPHKTDQIIVGSRYGIFISNDGGCHFKRISSPTETERATTSVAFPPPKKGLNDGGNR